MKNKIKFTSILSLLITILNLNAQDLKINEIRHYATYSPTGNFMPSFIELYNAGENSLDVGNYKIYNNKDSLLVSLSAKLNIPAKGYLTVLMGSGLDDLTFTENEATYHTQADSLNIFNTLEDAVGLYNGNNQIIDFVAWSESGNYNGRQTHSDAIGSNLWDDGIFVNTSGYSINSTIGRTIDGYDTNVADNWVQFNWTSQLNDTGAANPILTSPVNGSAINSDSLLVTWRAIPIAEEYRIELSLDKTFTTIEQTTLTTSTKKTISNLSVNTIYYCRISVRIKGEWITIKKSSCFALKVKLGVQLKKFPHLLQHKDSKMLCISYEEHLRFVPGLGRVGIFERPGCSEKTHIEGPWDHSHNPDDWELDEWTKYFINGDIQTFESHILDCKHCGNYCVRASIAMINNFYGGDLSQDRISYEIFKDWKPEADSDLGHGAGVFHNDTPEILAWSLETIDKSEIPRKINRNYQRRIPAPVILPLKWDKIKSEINNGKPIYIDWGSHASVICGYQEEINPLTGKTIKYVIVADPWAGNESCYVFEEFSKKLAWYILLPDKPLKDKGRKQESTMNSDIDKDGVIDFDEELRFCSVKDNPDTDKDCIPDKQEIRSYTFHNEDFGAHNNDALTFPDKDLDGKRAECDRDSDDGGVIDGQEDTNQNGVYEPGETDVYFAPDDLFPLWDFVKPFPDEYEMVHINGENFKTNTTFNYAIVYECGALLNDYPINPSGSFTTDDNGIFFNHPVGSFPEGFYEIIIDVNNNSIFDEECSDLRKCFEVMRTEEKGCCWRCDEGGEVILQEGVTMYDCLDVYSTSAVQYSWHPGLCNPTDTYSCNISGCIDPIACNYNSDATEDDGSCILPPVCNDNPCMGDIEVPDSATCTCEVIEPQVLGCTNPAADNYNPKANCDDGTCIPPTDFNYYTQIDNIQCQKPGDTICINLIAQNEVVAGIKGVDYEVVYNNQIMQPTDKIVLGQVVENGGKGAGLVNTQLADDKVRVAIYYTGNEGAEMLTGKGLIACIQFVLLPNPPVGTYNNIGTTKVELSYENEVKEEPCANTSFKVKANVGPMVTCPAETQTLIIDAYNHATLSSSIVTITGDCEIVSKKFSKDKFNCDDVGQTHPVTFTATDCTGKSSTCDLAVYVVLPFFEIICPTEVYSFVVDDTHTFTENDFNLPNTDQCGNPLKYSFIPLSATCDSTDVDIVTAITTTIDGEETECQIPVDIKTSKITTKGKVLYWNEERPIGGKKDGFYDTNIILCDTDAPIVAVDDKGCFSVEAEDAMLKYDVARTKICKPDFDIISGQDALLAALLSAKYKEYQEEGKTTSFKRYQPLAADYNDDGKVSAGDATLILDMSVGKICPDKKLWQFQKKATFADAEFVLDAGFPDNMNAGVDRADVHEISQCFSMATDVCTNPEEVTIYGILKGDVNGSWKNGMAYKRAQKTNDHCDVQFNFDEQSKSVEGNYILPISFEANDLSSAFDIDVFFNDDIDDIIAVELTEFAQSNNLSMAWNYIESDRRLLISAFTLQEIDASENLFLVEIEASSEPFETMVVSSSTFLEGVDCGIVPIIEIEPKKFSIYPNPNAGNFQLELDKPLLNGQVKIVDASGKVHYQNSIGQPVAVLKINLPNLKPGIYLVKVTDKNSTGIKKLVVH